MLGYASGNLGKNIVASTLGLFLIFYMTDILGIDPEIAGLVILVSLIWDALLDPVVGLISDRTKNALGKYGAYILLGAPMTALSFIAIFTLPVQSTSPLLVVTICLILFRTSYTLIDLPHNALLSRISGDSRERSTIAIARFFFSAVGSLCIALAGFTIFSDAPDQAQTTSFQSFSIFAGIICVLAMWVSWFAVRHQDKTAPSDRIPFRLQLRSAAKMMGDKDARIVIAVGFFTGLTTPVFAKALSYFGKYNLADETSIAAGLTAMMAGQALSTPLWIRMSHRFDKATALQAAHLMMIVGLFLFGLLITESGFPYMVLAFLVGAGAGGVFSIIWGMAPDVVDKQQLATGARSEAVYFSLLILAMKIALGLGMALFGGLLSALDYASNSMQTPSTLLGIKLLMCATPAIGSIICLISLKRYTISHRHHEDIAMKLSK